MLNIRLPFMDHANLFQALPDVQYSSEWSSRSSILARSRPSSALSYNQAFASSPFLFDMVVQYSWYSLPRTLLA